MDHDLIGNTKTCLGRCSLAVALAVLWFPSLGWAHKVTAAKLATSIDTVARTYELQAFMDVAPSEDAELNAEVSPEDAARQFAEEFLSVMIDEVEQKPDLNIELVEMSDGATPAELQRHQVVTTQRGTFGDTAEKLMLYLDNRCPMAVVMVVIEDKKPSRRMQVILPGEYSRPLELARLTEGDPFELSASGAIAGAVPDVPQMEGAPVSEPGKWPWTLAGAAVLVLGIVTGVWLARRGRRNRRSDGVN